MMRTLMGVVLAGLAGGVSLRAAAEDEHVGPHGGVVVEWGDEEYHPEIVVDAKAGTAVVYVYGNHTDFHKKKMRAIDSKSLTLVLKTTPPTTVKFEPAPEPKDPKGASTKFAAKHEAFTRGGKLEGTLSAKVGTKPYSGDFKQK